jgi:hypothetical protein
VTFRDPLRAGEKMFFIRLTPALRACYKEAGAIHTGVRPHTNRKNVSAAAFDA